MPAQRADLRARILAAIRSADAEVPAEAIDQIVALAGQAIGFEPDGSAASVLSGDPSLPPPVGWPQRPGLPDPTPLVAHVAPHRSEAFKIDAARPASLSHVATVDLAEAQVTGLAGSLPASGRLLFFCDRRWGPDLPAPFAGRVIFDEGSTPPRRMSRPADLLDQAAAWDETMIERAAQDDFGTDAEDDDLANPYFRPARPVRPTARWVVPWALIPTPLASTVAGAMEHDTMAGSYLFGPPLVADVDPRTVAAAGIDLGVPGSDRRALDEHAERLAKRADDFTLLARFALSDVDRKRTLGAVAFVIARDALAARRFNAAVAVFEA